MCGEVRGDPDARTEERMEGELWRGWAAPTGAAQLLEDLRWGLALHPLLRAGGDHLSMRDEWLKWPVMCKCFDPPG